MDEISGLRRDALVAELAKRMRANGSWCGETHLHKATYFLDEMLGVPTGLKHVLYAYGPFSFPLRRELNEMASLGLFDLERIQNYGPRLVVTEAAERDLLSQFPKTIGQYDDELDFVVQKLGDEGVAKLEELGTALWVIREEPGRSESDQAVRLNEIKPHVSVSQAQDALDRVKSWEAEWRQFHAPAA